MFDYLQRGSATNKLFSILFAIVLVIGLTPMTAMGTDSEETDQPEGQTTSTQATSTSGTDVEPSDTKATIGGEKEQSNNGVQTSEPTAESAVEPAEVASVAPAAVEPAKIGSVQVASDEPVLNGVAKVGDTEYATIDEAITAANDAGGAVTLTLLDNVSATKVIALNNSIGLTLDLAGHTLDTGAYGMTNAGTLSIMDSGSSGTIKVASSKTSTFTNLASGTVYAISGGTFENAGGYYVAVNNGTIKNISNGKFTDKGNTSGSSGFVNLGHIETISGGTFEDYSIALKNDEGSKQGTIDLISGGTFTGTAATPDKMPSAVQNWGKIGSITGGSFNGGDFGVGIGTWNYTGTNGDGVIGSISGGNFSGGYGAVVIEHYDAKSKAPAINTISGGTFTSDTAVIRTDRYKLAANPTALAYTVAGGTFNGPLSIMEGDSATITGGTWSADVDEYLPKGYKQNADGSVVPIVAASVNIGGDTTNYPTIDAAVSAANDAEGASMLTLLDNVVATKTVAFSGAGISLDLNGFTFDTGTYGMTNDGVLTIYGGSTDKGEIISALANGKTSKGALTNLSKGALAVDSGTVRSTGSNTPAFVNLGTVDAIAGGTFDNGAGYYIAVNLGDIETISDGVFTDEGNTSTASGFVNLGHIGTISGGSFYDYRIALKNDEGSKQGTIDLISGGTFTGTAVVPEVMPTAVQNWGKIGSITGGSFNGGDFGVGIGTWNYTGTNGDGVIGSISGGNFSGGYGAVVIEHYDAKSKAPSINTISGGTFTSDTAVIRTDRYKEAANPTALAYTVAGGTFNGPLSIMEGDSATITGGTWDADVNEYLPKGYAQDDNGNVAIAEYALTYDLAGGTLASSNPASYTYFDSNVTLNNPSREGCTFNGWKVNGGDTLYKTYTIESGSTGAMSFVADWTIDEYALTYDLAGGTLEASNPASYTTLSNDITLNNPRRDGYIFAGWKVNGGDTIYKTYTIAAGSKGAMSFTAQWEAVPTPVKPDVPTGGDVDVPDSGKAALTENAQAVVDSIVSTGLAEGVSAEDIAAAQLVLDNLKGELVIAPFAKADDKQAADVDEETKDKVSNLAASLGANPEVLRYLDIKVGMNLSDSGDSNNTADVNMAEISKPVTFEVEIPASKMNGKKLATIAVHNGVASQVDSTLNTAKSTDSTLVYTFDASKFSIYTLVSVDEATPTPTPTPAPTPTPVVDNNTNNVKAAGATVATKGSSTSLAKTGDNVLYAWLLIVPIIAAVGVIAISRKRRQD